MNSPCFQSVDPSLELLLLALAAPLSKAYGELLFRPLKSLRVRCLQFWVVGLSSLVLVLRLKWTLLHMCTFCQYPLLAGNTQQHFLSLYILKFRFEFCLVLTAPLLFIISGIFFLTYLAGYLVSPCTLCTIFLNTYYSKSALVL